MNLPEHPHNIQVAYCRFVCVFAPSYIFVTPTCMAVTLSCSWQWTNRSAPLSLSQLTK
mgnify:CR=1 FL=1